MRFGIRTKLLVFATLVWAVIFGVYSFYIYHERIEQTRRMALMAADLLSRKIAADRQYYASTVVKRALEAGLTVTGAQGHTVAHHVHKRGLQIIRVERRPPHGNSQPVPHKPG